MQLVAAEDGHNNHGAPVSEAAQVQQALHLQRTWRACSTSYGGSLHMRYGVS